MNIMGWLLALATPLVKRVLIALGIGVITYSATTALFNVLIDGVVAQMATVPQVVLQMASLFGATDAIGIWLGALGTQASLSAIKRFGIL